MTCIKFLIQIMKISTKQYAQALYELTLGKSESEVDIVVGKFIKELSKNNQMKFSSSVVVKFEEIYNRENGIIEATIISTAKLESSEIEKIKKYLMDKYAAKEVILENEIDKSIGGGFIIKVRDEILDASISSKLKGLREALLK